MKKGIKTALNDMLVAKGLNLGISRSFWIGVYKCSRKVSKAIGAKM